MQNLSFNQYLTAWKFWVVGKKAVQLPPELIASDLPEFQNWQRQLLQAKIDANNAGHTCNFNKGGTPSGRCAAWVVANGYTLKIVFNAKDKRPQKVTQTSRDAYHSIDFTTQRGQIASIIFDATRSNQDITRKEIEVLHGLGCNQVTGRVKELLEMSEEMPFQFGGKPYVLQVVTTRLSTCKGSSNVPNEALRWVLVAGDRQAAPSYNTALFQWLN